MRYAVLRARLSEAGFDVTMFSQADLARISRAMRELPPLPTPPVIAYPTLPTAEHRLLMDEIGGAAQCFLDALDDRTLLISFDRAELHERLREASRAISDALSGWMQRAAAVCAAGEAGCNQTAAAMEAGLAAMHRLVCLHAAAVIGGHAEADAFAAAMCSLEADLAAADAALGEVDAALTAIDRLFRVLIPDLLEAVMPLFEADAAGFSPADCRRAALTLRQAVQL
ncbi:MAG: hypothetical protein IJX53_04440 [Clostridia bacterium]|nr:hypothetical protein [Clostridia bacterium]